MTDPAKNGTFQQKLGLFDATMLVAGSMIGSGIFIVSADISRDVGSSGWLLGIWILTGLITVIGALSYAELAAMMPRAGGQYVYIREAYGPLPGFLYGWTFFLVIQTGFIAAVSVAFAKFLGVLAPELGTNRVLSIYGKALEYRLDIDYKLPVPWLEAHDWPSFFKRDVFAISPGQLVAVGVAVSLTAINCFGVQAGKLVQNVFTVTKLLSLAVLIVLGLTIAVEPQVLADNFRNLWDGIWTTKQFAAVNKIVPSAGVAAAMVAAAAMVGSLFSADSWNNVTFTAGETKDPKRNLPRSLVLGTVIVVTLYVLANVAYLAALPIQGDESPAAKAKVIAAQEAESEVQRIGASIEDLEDAQKKWSSWAAQKKNLDTANKEELNKGALQQKLLLDRRKELSDARERSKLLNAEAAFVLGINHAKDDRVGTAVLEQVSPDVGVPLMAIAIMISTFGCVNGLVLMGPRLYWAMAHDGVFFKSVGRLNARGVPVAGLVLQCLWSIVLIFSGTYSDLLDYIIFAALLFYAVTVAGLFILRRTQPDAERPYKALGYPLVPALYVVACTLIMLDLLVVKPVYSWPSFLIVLAGIPVYFMWRRRSA
jgi:amino acid transporter